jgi:hypothetical protein
MTAAVLSEPGPLLFGEHGHSSVSAVDISTKHHAASRKMYIKSWAHPQLGASLVKLRESVGC